MHPPHQHSRIDLTELKAQIMRKLGPDKSKQYFSYLNRLLSLKLSKAEFNNLCVKIIGRENIPLHNQFIRSILKNACTSKVPPPVHDHQKNGSHGSHVAISNGDILPLSPRKARTRNLRQNGKTNQRSVHSNESLFRRDRGPLEAPLGVPFCPVSVGGTRRRSLLNVGPTSNCISSSNYGALLDSITLRERMDHIAITHELQGVTMDSANLLNNGLDIYLKGIIKSCIQLVKARFTQKPKLINGRFQMQTSGGPGPGPITLQDFRLAMELNPQQLGEDWPLLLEKICINSFNE